MGAGKNFLARLFLGELFIWPAAPIVHGALAGYALNKTYREEQTKKRIADKEAEAAKYEGNNWKQFFKEENMTDEDKRMLWYGFIPVKEITRTYALISEKVPRLPRVINGIPQEYSKGGADWSWKYRSPESPKEHIELSSYSLFPEMKIVHDTYKEVNGRYLWENDTIVNLNRLSELTKVSGYSSESTKFFNWLANGYIRISEDEWGFVGYENVFKVLEKSNGENFLEDPTILELNKDSIENWEIDSDLFDTAWIDYNTEEYRRFKTRDYVYRLNDIDFDLTRQSMIPFTQRHIDDLTKLFKEGRPIACPCLYGYVRVDKDKYIYVGLNTARQIYRKANERSMFDNEFFRIKDHIVTRDTIDDIFEKWVKEGKDPMRADVQAFYGYAPRAIILPWGRDGLRLTWMPTEIFEEEFISK